MADYRESGRRLDDVQTRYKTLQDLREVWQLGLEAHSRVLPQYRSKADTIMISSLTAALELLEHQIDLMSSFDMKKFQLQRTINELPTADRIALDEREEQARLERRKDKDPIVSDGNADPGQPPVGPILPDSV